MPQNVFQLKFPLAPWMIFPLAGALAVVGAKIWMIAQNGSPTPYWDQWGAEGAILYPKYFDGTLSFSDLIAPHNEHRILVTRLWSLLLLELGGYWDPILQMLANTAILGAFVALLVTAFRPVMDGASWIALVLFSTVILALPFGWESTLAGFQSPWYFVLLFGIGGLFMITDAAAFAPRWWLALLLVVLSYFSLASGAFAAAAAFAIGAMQFSVRQRSGRRELLALALLAAVTIVMIVYTPALRGHSQLAAHSIGQFLHAMVQILSWPATQNQASLAKVIAGTILVQAPAVLVSAYVIWLRPPLTDRRWLVVTLTGWAVLQAIAVAFGRSVAPMSSRYLDLFAVGVVLNFACLLYLLSASEMARLRRLLALGAALWLLLVLFGATKTLFTRTLPEVAQRQAQGRMQTENMRAYLATGDIRILQNKPFLSIPFPSAERLAQIASQPLIRALLPPELVSEPSPQHAQARGLARFTGRPIQILKAHALRWGVLLIPTGFTLFLVGMTMQLRRKPETASL